MSMHKSREEMTQALFLALVETLKTTNNIEDIVINGFKGFNGLSNMSLTEITEAYQYYIENK